MSYTDEQIISGILKGKPDDFRQIMERYEEPVKRIVLRNIPRDDMEDVMQEVFIRVYRNLGKFGGRSSFKTWIGAIAVRTCCDFWRKHGRKREKNIPELNEDQQSWIERAMSSESGSRFDCSERGREAKEILFLVYQHLAAEDRMLLNLVYIEEHSMSETAELMGWSITKTKVKTFRTRKKFRKILDKIVTKGEIKL